MRWLVHGLALAVAACTRTAGLQPSGARYLVTASPINVGLNTPLCIAVDPGDARGVWWWEPGGEGCSNRSTGPGVFEAHEASVSRLSSGAIDARFRLGLHVAVTSTAPPFLDLQFILEHGTMLAVKTGARVPTGGRNDLDIPGFDRP